MKTEKPKLVVAGDKKKTLFRVEIVVIILLILAIPLLFFRPTVTGFVSTNTYGQVIGLTFTESQALAMRASQQIALDSISAAGEITGNGAVAIYISNSDGSERTLVYTNAIMEDKRKNLITGYSVGAAYAQEEPAQDISVEIDLAEKLEWQPSLSDTAASTGPFTGCVDSCFLNSEKFTGSEFKILVYVEPGTSVKLAEVFYTVVWP